jgi:hypothetical protein
MAGVIEDTLTAEGGVNTKQLVNFPLSNWALLNGATGGTSLPPHSQTAPLGTCIAAIVLVPFFTGVFEVSYNISFSDNTTAGLLQTFLSTKVGAGAGALAGGNSQVRLGTGAASVAGVSTPAATANGMVLNVDAAGGSGITFEGLAVGNGAAGVQNQMQDQSSSLTGLLTANSQGSNRSTGFTVVDSTGLSSNVKTPFLIGQSTTHPVCFSLSQQSTAAHVISYQAFHLFVREIPVA